MLLKPASDLQRGEAQEGRGADLHHLAASMMDLGHLSGVCFLAPKRLQCCTSPVCNLQHPLIDFQQVLSRIQVGKDSDALSHRTKAARKALIYILLHCTT
jgi:hypothetical protein